MSCQCRKNVPAQIIIGISLLLIVLFDQTKWSSFAFPFAMLLQAIGIGWVLFNGIKTSRYRRSLLKVKK